MTGQEIDVSLYVQDEMDRQHTVLYGINEEAGKYEGTHSKSTIRVNQHCLNCSGNANYIRKAFKIACLQYQPSKVRYNDEDYSRESLFNMRYALFQGYEQIHIDKLNTSIISEESKIAQLQDQEKGIGKLDNTIGIRDSNLLQAMGITRPGPQDESSATTYLKDSTANLLIGVGDNLNRGTIQEEANTKAITIGQPRRSNDTHEQMASGSSDMKTSGGVSRTPLSRRGLSATLGRKGQIQLDEKELQTTMPLNASRPTTLHASPTMVEERSNSRPDADSALRMKKELGGEFPHMKDRQAQPRRTQVLIKSDEGKLINMNNPAKTKTLVPQHQSSLGASTRISVGQQ